MKQPDGIRLLGWVIPMLCMAVASWVVIKQNTAFQETSALRDKANRDVEQAQKDQTDAEKAQKEKRYAAEPDVSGEQGAFLRFLQTRAAAHQVQLVRWGSQSTEYGKDKSDSAVDPKVVAMLKGIRKITSNLTLAGSTIGLRDLVHDLESSNRLYTISNVIWTRTDQGTSLTMNVSRYVEPPTPATPTASITIK